MYQEPEIDGKPAEVKTLSQRVVVDKQLVQVGFRVSDVARSVSQSMLKNGLLILSVDYKMLNIQENRDEMIDALEKHRDNIDNEKAAMINQINNINDQIRALKG